MGEKERLERTRIFGWLVILMFLILTGRLWYLQIAQGHKYVAMADGNRIRWLRTTAPRGRIFDRNGVPLATNRASFTVSLMPGGLTEESRVQLMDRLSELLGLTMEELEYAIAKGSRYPYEAIRVMQDVPSETVIALEERRYELPGVMVEMEEVREYPFKSAASHVLGYMAPITKELLVAWSDADYYGSDYVGFSGLERLYESYLRGEDGGSRVEVSALNRPVRILDRTPPVPGADLVLTLDQKLQELTETIIDEELVKLREAGKYEEAYNGVVVVLDPKSGAIRALASIPGFDPNRLSDTVERSSYFLELSHDPNRPFFHRAVQGLYSPGSAFKPLVALAALEEGKTTPTEVFYADGIGPYGIKRCWTLTADPPLPPHGNLTLSEAIKVSCNDFFWELGLRLGIDTLAEYSRKAGFGKATGLPMYPTEEAGLVPDPDWKRERYWRKPRSEQVWYPVETMDVAIGQGFLLVTPIQMASFYMGLANRGTIYQPYLLDRIQLPTGEIIEKTVPEVLVELEASAETWQAIVEGMTGVVESGGTGAGAFRNFPYPIKIAGKTGSAQLGPGQGDAHGWFGGFAPADDPEIVVVVFVEHGGGGAASSAPITRRILEEYFRPRYEIDE